VDHVEFACSHTNVLIGRLLWVKVYLSRLASAEKIGPAARPAKSPLVACDHDALRERARL